MPRPSRAVSWPALLANAPELREIIDVPEDEFLKRRDLDKNLQIQDAYFLRMLKATQTPPQHLKLSMPKPQQWPKKPLRKLQLIWQQQQRGTPKI